MESTVFEKASAEVIRREAAATVRRGCLIKVAISSESDSAYLAVHSDDVYEHADALALVELTLTVDETGDLYIETVPA